jgi:hypothetical protein
MGQFQISAGFLSLLLCLNRAVSLYKRVCGLNGTVSKSVVALAAAGDRHIQERAAGAFAWNLYKRFPARAAMPRQ